jgi:hypothetical protein
MQQKLSKEELEKIRAKFRGGKEVEKQSDEKIEVENAKMKQLAKKVQKPIIRRTGVM